MTTKTPTSTVSERDRRLAEVKNGIPKKARQIAADELGVTYNAAKSESDALYAASRPEPKVGQVRMIVRGKGEGKSGKIVWVGKTKWGNRIAVATSDERLPNGRYRDVVYARPAWTKTVDAARDARLAELNKILSNCDRKVMEPIYHRELLRLYREAAAAWNVTEAVLFKRTIEVMEEEIARLKEYDSRLCENHWACDGPAYGQVERQSEGINREINDLSEIVALLKSETA
jgi:hypothetical protein